MKIKSVLPFVAIFIFLSSCTSDERTLFNSSQTLEGITISIEEVDLTSSKTILTIQVALDSSWNIDLTSDISEAPMISLSRILISDNQNNVYLPHSSSYRLSQNDSELTGTLDSETGEILFKRLIEINSLPSDTKYITLQLSLEIKNIPGENSLSIDLQHHPVDEEWMLNEEIAFAGIPLQLEKAIIREATKQTYFFPEEEEPIVQDNPLQLEIWGTSKFSPDYEITGFAPRIDYPNLISSNLSVIVGPSSSFNYSDGIVSSTIPLNPSVENNTINNLEDSISFSFYGDILVNKLWQLTWVLDEQP